MTYPKILQSSVNSNNLSLTVGGILVAILPTVLILLHAYNVNVGQEDISNVIDAIVTCITTISAAISAVMFTWGLIRKIAVSVGWVKNNE